MIPRHIGKPGTNVLRYWHWKKCMVRAFSSIFNYKNGWNTFLAGHYKSLYRWLLFERSLIQIWAFWSHPIENTVQYSGTYCKSPEISKKGAFSNYEPFEPHVLVVYTVFHYDAWNDRFSLKHQWTHVNSL